MNILCIITLSVLIITLLIIIISNYIKIINENIYENFSIKHLSIKDDLLQYIQNNRPNELVRKTSSDTSLSDTQYLDIYLDSIQKLNKNEINKLNKLIKSIDRHIKNICTPTNYQKWLSKKSEWNYLKLGNNNLEFNYPFSLGKYIFLRPYNLNYSNKKLKKLLLHEFIHVIQRRNQTYFNQQYLKHLPLIKLSNLHFKNSFYKNIITNPDSPDNGWLVYLKNNNTLFVPALMLSDYKTKEVAIMLEKSDYPQLYQDVMNIGKNKKLDTKIVLSNNETKNLYEMTDYVEMLNRHNGLYNPNEYLAYFLEDSLYDDPKKFNQLINKYFNF